MTDLMQRFTPSSLQNAPSQSASMPGSESKRDEPRTFRHPAILRVSGIGVAGILATLMVTAVVPPIVADQSDRAVVDAPVTLLTASISGEVDALGVEPGHDVTAGQRIAEISNPRIDRGTLISLEEKSADAHEKLRAAQLKRQTDSAYLASLDAEIASQTAQLHAQLESQIEELRARVAQSSAMSGEKKALVDRQSDMVSRNAASMDMLRPTQQQYSAALHNTDAETSKLRQKMAQFDALNKGIYVGEELVPVNVLAQKRRDIDLDAKTMEIEEKQQSGVINNLQRIIDVERERIGKLGTSSVTSSSSGRVLSVGAAAGRHVSPGDTIASVIDCNKQFVAAIFSYRQGESMKPGTRVRVDGGSFRSGVVASILPKTSDKVDDRYAVPFPQTERRELYAIIAPDDAESTATADRSCAVGQWVTVTRDNGVVPSMSVSWRRLGTLLAYWLGSDRTVTDAERLDATRRLTALMRSPPKQDPMLLDPDWQPRSRAIVSR
jgi:multidrug resistance efflux pump